MTETLEPEAIDTDAIDISAVDEAIAMIDAGLGTLLDRELVSSNEVSDLLLDVRAVLARKPEEMAETLSVN